MSAERLIPPVLYRFISKEEYARDFIEHGEFRMGSLDYYASIEDLGRRDTSEGTGRINSPALVDVIKSDVAGGLVVESQPGTMEHESINLNCKFIMCCSAPLVNIENMLIKFRAHFVLKINNPWRLAEDVTLWARKAQISLIGNAEWIKVRYDKGLSIDESYSGAQFAELSYSQKNLSYSDEYEYRLVVITANTKKLDEDEENDPGCDSYLDVKIGSRLDYVELNSGLG